MIDWKTCTSVCISKGTEDKFLQVLFMLINPVKVDYKFCLGIGKKNGFRYINTEGK